MTTCKLWVCCFFIALYGSKNNIAFVTVFCCDHGSSWTDDILHGHITRQTTRNPEFQGQRSRSLGVFVCMILRLPTDAT